MSLPASLSPGFVNLSAIHDEAAAGDCVDFDFDGGGDVLGNRLRDALADFPEPENELCQIVRMYVSITRAK